MAVRRVPNARLRELLKEARWTGEQLARAVNQIGAESGWARAYGRASVHQWLTGAVPRKPAPHLVCAALGRRLRRPVTLADAGFGDPPPDTPTPDSPAVLARLAAAAAAPDRHGNLLSYQPPPAPSGSPTGLTEGPTEAAIGGPTEALTGPPVPAGAKAPPPQPDALALLLPVFSAIDRVHGGGQARTALAAFLSTTAAPMLAAPAPPVRHFGILGATARLCYLCAFMHIDDDLNGLAGQYYRLALDLARHAGDTAAQAMTLRAMATQAYELGHRRQSLRLAQAAADCRISSSAPRLRASVLGQLALSEAAVGDRTAALRHIGDARDLLTNATGPPPPIGDYHRASWDHQRALVGVELGDPAGAIKLLEVSAARRPRGESRSRAVILSRLAERQLAAGHIEAACATWHEFLDVYPLLASRRAHLARARMPGLLLPHRRRPAADHLIQRATALGRV
ncbi:tol-pal system YbgF family protein [Kitasatospora sp. NPDC059812]|uniref:tetratricopeptide repeat protein n=1 Tax=Kitasatospora sp. NPDC059812 TaxID=3346958 RepID=UPI00364F23C7